MKRFATRVKRDTRPEFAGRVLTSTSPLKNPERLTLWRTKMARSNYKARIMRPGPATRLINPHEKRL